MAIVCTLASDLLALLLSVEMFSSPNALAMMLSEHRVLGTFTTKLVL